MLHLRRLAAPALACVLLAAAGCSSTDPATKLTRELLAMPKEDAYARGEALVEAGARHLVAGSAVFGRGDVAGAVRELRAAASLSVGKEA